jgi:ankyrin repeat protein
VEIAARRWSPEGVRFLLDNGLVVKHVSVQNALVTAASNGCEPIVRMLLDAGADVNGLDERNDSALAMARRVNNQQIARLLIDRGARDAR